MKIKLISEKYQKYEKLLSEIDDEKIIPKGKYSKIYSTIIDMWCKCCDDKDDKEKIEKHYSKLEEWYILLSSGIKGLRKVKLEKIENDAPI